MNACPSWCRTTHAPTGSRIHRSDLLVIAGPPALTIHLLQGQAASGDLGDPTVRVFYDVDTQTRVMDLTPQASADWSDVLNVLDVATLPLVADALSRPYEMAGGAL
ncbi:hypothetical protein ACFYY8_33415 [Streptosporangium sp. NPDC001559]|uniref:hypothetical protein n=1 Tax=Streptosporangium sp. NPDC001559 TaxID=3366187 RepID=UPI0036F157A8